MSTTGPHKVPVLHLSEETLSSSSSDSTPRSPTGPPLSASSNGSGNGNADNKARSRTFARKQRERKFSSSSADESQSTTTQSSPTPDSSNNPLPRRGSYGSNEPPLTNKAPYPLSIRTMSPASSPMQSPTSSPLSSPRLHVPKGDKFVGIGTQFQFDDDLSTRLQPKELSRRRTEPVFHVSPELIASTSDPTLNSSTPPPSVTSRLSKSIKHLARSPLNSVDETSQNTSSQEDLAASPSRIGEIPPSGLKIRRHTVTQPRPLAASTDSIEDDQQQKTNSRHQLYRRSHSAGNLPAIPEDDS